MAAATATPILILVSPILQRLTCFKVHGATVASSSIVSVLQQPAAELAAQSAGQQQQPQQDAADTPVLKIAWR